MTSKTILFHTLKRNLLHAGSEFPLMRILMASLAFEDFVFVLGRRQRESIGRLFVALQARHSQMAINQPKARIAVPG